MADQEQNEQQEQQQQQEQEQQGQSEDQGAASAPTDTDSTQQHGSTVNAYKHQREVGKLQSENKALQEELDSYKALKKEFDEFKAEQQKAQAEREAKETNAKLEAAGCIDTVSASARLKEFEGDIEKLKESAPHLFSSSEGNKKTGGTAKGAPSPDDARNERLREIMGLTDKEK